jgi:hypothetical protein
MRYFPYPMVLSTALLLGAGLTSVLEAGPSAPRERSFRPVVPIKQNVRGGMDKMKSQTVRLTIPPPPIPESVPASSSAALTSDTPVPVLPDPEAPSSEKNSPCRISSDTSRRACTRPKDLLTLRTEIMPHLPCARPVRPR